MSLAPATWTFRVAFFPVFRKDRLTGRCSRRARLHFNPPVTKYVRRQ